MNDQAVLANATTHVRQLTGAADPRQLQFGLRLSFTGIYRSESNDGGRSFTPRQLISEGLIQGTPVLLPQSEGFRAIWQSDQGSRAHVIATYLDAKGIIGGNYSMETNSELPAASLVQDQIQMAYIRQAENNRRSVWLLRKSVNSN